MKLAVSNIAWSDKYDEKMFVFLNKMGFSGLEIAPSRIISNKPYEHKDNGKDFADCIKERYDLSIPSMQSIWYGKTEQMFGIDEERNYLLDYTKDAIDFAEVLGCSNLVFGCPKNRISKSEQDYEIAINFFRELGEYAYSHNTILSLEANPVIYNTNFINATNDAVELIKSVSSKGFKLNLDLGTMIYNNESVDIVRDEFPLINHIHISEPNMLPIVPRELHNELAVILKENKYDHFISIEMGKTDSLNEVIRAIRYIKDIFS